MQKPTCLTILACLTLAACSTVRSAELHDLDPDRDGDGLSDFQEVHKYCTNPDSADSDGDGVADSDWHERREYSYSIRTVIQVLPAYDKATLEDDYQDCRVLFECDEYIELEVIHYPLNTVGTVIGAREQWRAQRQTCSATSLPGSPPTMTLPCMQTCAAGSAPPASTSRR